MDFLKTRAGISSVEELKLAITQRLQDMELNQKKWDFAHLLFNESNAKRILQFNEIVANIINGHKSIPVLHN